MTAKFAVGIDLGTSTSEICIYRDKMEPLPIPDPSTKTPIVPSVVAVNPKGALLIGDTALSRVDLPGQGVREVKRKMGTAEKVKLLNQEYRPEEISALILKKLKENAEEALGISIKEVVLSVPANFPDAARQATLTAGELAGLKILRLINEPTAAALAFGIKNLNVEEKLLVFDFGGGTLDVTVLEMIEGILDVKSSYGDPHLGGKDFDAIMIDQSIARFQATNPHIPITDKSRAAMKAAAESTKKNLSSQTSYTISIPNFAVQNGEPIDLEIDWTRPEFEQAIAPLLERAKACLLQALNAKQIRPHEIDRILLVGGTTYIPAVRKLVAQVMGKEPIAGDVNPDLAVAIGASVAAAISTGLIDDESGIILTDVAPFGLGIDVVQEYGGQYIITYAPLIQPNTTIPYSMNKRYSLMSTDSDEVVFHLYQDHTGRAKLPSDAVDTGSVGRITGIPPSEDGSPRPIDIEFSYNTNGLATVRATIPGTGKSEEIVYGKSALRMDAQDKAEASDRIRELWRQNAKARKYEGLIDKAERLMAGIPPQERSPLSRAVTELKEALTVDNVKGIETAGDTLVDLLYDLDNTGI